MRILNKIPKLCFPMGSKSYYRIKFFTLNRDVVALLKSGGAHLYWALFPGENWGGPKYFLP